MIWTTTPWTLPANQALNLNPQLDYALVDTERGPAVLAEALVEQCLARYGLDGASRRHRRRRSARGARASATRSPRVDPGYDRVAPVYLADYATAEDGTGIVHSAPAYGVDDFNSCRAHGMRSTTSSTRCRATACYEAALPLFGGQDIWKANPPIVEALRDAGRLLASATLVHSYPHCWRHKTPVIYRAAAQWFVRMDEPTLDAACSPPTRRRRRCARRRSTAIDADRLLPRERPGRGCTT